MKKNTIHELQVNIAGFQKKQIAKEFDTTHQNVLMALKYVNNSELAKRIRSRAKEILKNEISKIENQEQN